MAMVCGIHHIGIIVPDFEVGQNSLLPRSIWQYTRAVGNVGLRGFSNPQSARP